MREHRSVTNFSAPAQSPFIVPATLTKSDEPASMIAPAETLSGATLVAAGVEMGTSHAALTPEALPALAVDGDVGVNVVSSEAARSPSYDNQRPLPPCMTESDPVAPLPAY